MPDTELLKAIDRSWEATQPLPSVRPMVILDLVTYLLFVKRLDELQTYQEQVAEKSGIVLENLLFTKDTEAFRWKKFKHLDRKSLHQLFVREGGALSFYEQYGHEPHIFSCFLKAPLLVPPTPILLENAVAIVTHFEQVEKEQRPQLFEYLIAKVGVASNLRQLPVSPILAKFMVALAAPQPGDLILDPAAGAATFLVPCEQYLKETFPQSFKEETTHNSFFADLFLGLEKDPLLLRIGAMKMILNGIDDPQLKELETVAERDSESNAETTIVISSIPLTNEQIVEEATDVDAVRSTDTGSGLFYFDFIVDSLKEGGKAVLLVPETLMVANTAAPKNMRQQLVNHFNLQAVFFIPGGAFQPFSGMGAFIIVFKKQAPTKGGTVLFCNLDMEYLTPQKTLQEQDNFSGAAPAFKDGYKDLQHLIDEVNEPVKMSGTPVSKDCFYVPLPLMRDHQYDFKSAWYRQKITGQTEEKVSSYSNTGFGKTGIPGINVIANDLDEIDKPNAVKKTMLWLFVFGLVLFLVYFFVLRKNNEKSTAAVTKATFYNIVFSQG